MFDENQLVKIKWHSHNKQYFIKMGLTFTKIGDEIEIPAKMLSKESHARVKCTCDYCGKEYYTDYNVCRRSLLRGKLACEACKQKKREDSFTGKYGVGSPGASDVCRQRAQDTMIDKYGERFALRTKEGQESFKKSMLEKYDCDNPMKSRELMYKARISTYENGTNPSSRPEREVIKMLEELYGKDNCVPGYPVDRTNLDCLLTVDDIKIDVEYDGKYWHQDKLHDQKRNHWLIANGYKVIRILGNPRDTLPSKEQLKEEVDYILAGHDLGYIDMNE